MGKSITRNNIIHKFNFFFSKLLCRGLFGLSQSRLGYSYLWTRDVTCGNLKLSYPYDPRENEAGSRDTEVTWLKIELDFDNSNQEGKLCPRFRQRAYCSLDQCRLRHSLSSLVK